MSLLLFHQLLFKSLVWDVLSVILDKHDIDCFSQLGT